MRNQASEVYNYLQRPVGVSSSEPDIQEVLITNYPGIKKYTIKGREYYSLPPVNNSSEPQPDMGCSEKIILYNQQDLINSVQSDTKPNACALLKLPKHGNIKQVQSEAMALGLAATVFGLTTASATMVNYAEEPALFVPFDNMQPLTQIAVGENHTEKNDKPAFENSTIAPLGNGLAPNIFLEDFGSSFGLMYLCGDPDAVGRNNQNKGFIGRELYIFDQAIITHEYPVYFDLFTLDSRLCQTPSTSLGKRLRHTRGRNFSILEDASIDEKFASLDYSKLDATLQYCNNVIAGLQEHTDFSNPKQAKNHKTLLKYAQDTKIVIENRIDKYLQIMPKTQKVQSETVKNALILEKILNKPKLFTSIGIPYRNLTTNSPHELKISTIVKTERDKIKISFNQEFDPATIAKIEEKLGKNNIQINSAEKSLILPKSSLKNLEKIFYPETSIILENDVAYFSPSHIAELCKTYNYEKPELIKLTQEYVQLISSKNTIGEIVDTIKEYQTLFISQTAKENKELPFYQHLTKCFEFDAQQRIQRQLQQNFTEEFAEDAADDLIDTQNQAFSTAIKLDCIIEFNNLSLFYANNLNNPQVVAKTQALFAKYANINDQEMTIENAMKVRKNFISEIRNCIKFKNTNEFKSRFQEIAGTKSESSADTKEEEQNRTPKA